MNASYLSALATVLFVLVVLILLTQEANNGWRFCIADCFVGRFAFPNGGRR